MGDIMKKFLIEAAKCESGRGILLGRGDKRIAGLAVSAGYGVIFGTPRMELFIINETGRNVICPAMNAH